MVELVQALEFWHWWVLAAVLIGIEIFAPSTVLVWPGIAAIIVGAVMFFVPDLGWQYQLLIFAVLALGSLIAWRAYVHTQPKQAEELKVNLGGARHVGRELILTEPIANRRGRLEVDGVIWKIEGDDAEAGTRVRITGADGTVLKVEPA